MRRLLLALGLAAALVAVRLLPAPPPASASGGQIAMIEDDAHMLQSPAQTLQTFRQLGGGVVRMFLEWSKVAPNATSHTQPAFDPTNPGAYPTGNWAQYDAVARAAGQAGFGVDFIVGGGAPLWAEPPGIPPGGYNIHFAWYPSAQQYGLFAQAVGKRYSGNYPDPLFPGRNLPRVHFWTIWNEPNFGEDLGPQATNGSRVSVAPGLYRSLVDAGWNALRSTGHRFDTILIGDLAARGINGPPNAGAPQGYPGNYGQTKPLQFIRTLYCVDKNFNKLRGNRARAVGCPTSRSGRRNFRRNHPGLFKASGFGIHPYPGNLPPTLDGSSDPDFAAFSHLPKLATELDQVFGTNGSHKHLSIYNDEYGYITDPPSHPPYVSPATAARYENQAEYLSWINPRIKSYMQYPVWDPAATPGQAYAGFASGLFFPDGTQKQPVYDAYRIPIYLPNASARRHHRLEVWGGIRPAHYAQQDTGSVQRVEIQFQRHSSGAFTTLKTLRIRSANGYFDVHMKFPTSGMVRLAWTFPRTDPTFASIASAAQVFSRSVHVRIH